MSCYQKQDCGAKQLNRLGCSSHAVQSLGSGADQIGLFEISLGRAVGEIDA